MRLSNQFSCNDYNSPFQCNKPVPTRVHSWLQLFPSSDSQSRVLSFSVVYRQSKTWASRWWRTTTPARRSTPTLGTFALCLWQGVLPDQSKLSGMKIRRSRPVSRCSHHLWWRWSGQGQHAGHQHWTNVKPPTRVFSKVRLKFWRLKSQVRNTPSKIYKLMSLQSFQDGWPNTVVRFHR